MKKTAISLFLLASLPCLAQTDNTFYAKQFQGKTAGAKIAAAQLACNSNTAIPCIIVIDPSLAAWTSGTTPTKCVQCIWIDFRNSQPFSSATNAVTNFGTVDPTGVADSTAAFQACINTGFPCTVPPPSPGTYYATYKVCGLLPFVNNGVGILMLVGSANDRQRQGFSAAGIWTVSLTCASGDMITMPATAPPNGTYVGISGLILNESSSTNSGHIIDFGSSANIVDFELKDVFLNQDNPGKTCIVGSGTMQEMKMDRVFAQIANGNTAACVQLDGGITAVDIGGTNFTSGYYPTGTHAAHYLVDFNHTSGTANLIHFHDIVCEGATAGCIRLANLYGTSENQLDNISDNDEPVTPTGSFISIGGSNVHVAVNSIWSIYGTSSVPSLVCPAGICSLNNTAMSYVSLGGLLITNNNDCMDNPNKQPCKVWQATTLTGQTGNSGTSNFNPPKAGWYRVTSMACITTIGTAGNVNASVWVGLSSASQFAPGGANVSFTSPLGTCSVSRADERVPIAGSSYNFGPGGNVTGNVGGQYSLDAYAEWMGP